MSAPRQPDKLVMPDFRRMSNDERHELALAGIQVEYPKVGALLTARHDVHTQEGKNRVFKKPTDQLEMIALTPEEEALIALYRQINYFPTPPWATRALCEFLIAEDWGLCAMNCREPAANRGHMVAPLREYFADVEASDVHDYGAGFPVADYLWGPLPAVTDWTITNPPFRLAEQFIERARQTSRLGVAMIVRAAFLEGQGRFERLFSQNPPAFVLQFTERVVMHKGRLAPEGSTATAYAWLVWVDGTGPTQLRWIAPCRKRLERAGDYPPATPTPEITPEVGS